MFISDYGNLSLNSIEGIVSFKFNDWDTYFEFCECFILVFMYRYRTWVEMFAGNKSISVDMKPRVHW